ncbi:hypothetical protein, partial [Nitratireductor sp. XY-223]|uniref:hypothetical protein n=1 Tax=Nitratireductor sp. XY-223 TaxID=2561926 RepID=UPI0019822055
CANRLHGVASFQVQCPELNAQGKQRHPILSSFSTENGTSPLYFKRDFNANVYNAFDKARFENCTFNCGGTIIVGASSFDACRFRKLPSIRCKGGAGVVFNNCDLSNCETGRNREELDQILADDCYYLIGREPYDIIIEKFGAGLEALTESEYKVRIQQLRF